MPGKASHSQEITGTNSTRPWVRQQALSGSSDLLISVVIGVESDWKNRIFVSLATVQTGLI